MSYRELELIEKIRCAAIHSLYEPEIWDTEQLQCDIVRYADELEARLKGVYQPAPTKFTRVPPIGDRGASNEE